MQLRLDDTGFGGIEIFQNPQEFCYGVDAVLLADFASKPPSAAKEKSRIRDVKMSSKMATSYYQNMANQHRAEDSYFFNQKK